MTAPPGSDLILRRDRAAILAEILASRTAYVPDWLPAEGGPGHGVADILAGYLELLQERLAKVPDHRQAVLLDMLGVALLPAQGARTHVTMKAVPGTRGVRVPRGTRVGATVPGRDRPVTFETLDTVAISPASVVEVHSVLPAADAERDHSADVLAREPFTLFDGTVRVDREIFVGHQELLAFSGRAVVELQVGMGIPAPDPLPIEWSWWDGAQWRAFSAFAASALEAGDDDSVDGTQGLTRSGTIRLVAAWAKAMPVELDGRTTHWVRGRLGAPLQLPAGTPPPTVSRLRVAAVNEQRRLRTTVSADPAGPELVVWWPEGPTTPVTAHVLDRTSGARLDGYVTATKSFSPTTALGASVPLNAVLGHTVQVGVSPAASRPAGPHDGDAPRRVACDSDDELTHGVLADAGSRVEVTVSRGLPLDKAIADRRAADPSKTFAPMGPSPVRGSAFLFACAPATHRPGSRVTLQIERPVTAAEEADELSGVQSSIVTSAKDRLDEAIALLEGAEVTQALATAASILGDPLPKLTSSDAAAWYAAVRQQVQLALNALKEAAKHDNDSWDHVTTTVIEVGIMTPAPVLTGPAVGLALLPPLVDAGNTVAMVLADIAQAVERLAAGVPQSMIDERNQLQSGLPDANLITVGNKRQPLASSLVNLLAGATPWLPATQLPAFLAMDPDDFVDEVEDRIADALAAVQKAQQGVVKAIDKLKDINPATLAGEIVPSAATDLNPPVVSWDYHDGERWRPLGAEGDPDVLALRASGSVRFTVPDDMAELDVDGDVRRWMRARLAEGSFSSLRLVSWTDTSGIVNFLPVVEPRPPMLDRVEVFYTHTSSAVDAELVLVRDVHQWRDLTPAVTWPAAGAVPFEPMPDLVPTLYVGLDGELPAERVSLWLQPSDPSPWAVAHRPVWEGWDGTAWVRLVSDDGTDGLRRSGVVGLLWPGTSGAPGVTVSGAIGRTISLVGLGAALRFRAGDRLMLADLQGQEPVVVDAAAGETVTTRAPLSRAYAGAQLVTAPPARFGSPRTWLRALFDATRPPPALRLSALAAHAVAVAQVETIRDELLGSGDGSPGQRLVARRFPVEGDPVLEVRELDGDRADVDADVLRRTLEAHGIDLAAVRTEHDPRTGRVTEVWVPWSGTTSLGAAGPFDRVYVVDHAKGRFLFGGAGHGRALPAGRDNVRLRSYRTCEGEVGNVGAHRLDKLLSAVAVGEVTNPEPASGGAEVEPLAAALRRGPSLLRHRRLSLTERDVEAIAAESSPAVVRARAVGAQDRHGRPLPGAVRVVVVPRDGSRQPRPGPALLAVVKDAIVASSPAVATRRVTVEGPAYLAVGVSVTVVPQYPDEAGAVREGVVRALEVFLHPLAGGPDGTGWDFGQGSHLSDVARVLESVSGVDAVTDLVLTRDGMPVGDAVLAAPDQVVCAGPIVVRLGGGL
ncbi:hypothetical protein ASC64_18860 [Nocardioides sp. Root122]|uniref:hypothetical protein n=1 Tax=Nocardioides TaxID=1839 RepID=UPI0007023E15|nr:MULTISPECIES: hypothetical protein [Nocardioides]KQV73498.1 hypothetical protein ASC64_18860 [Nocardioides sp. Root122]MCK9825240.1 hypothetical protein [Nocardioides cavernae]